MLILMVDITAAFYELRSWMEGSSTCICTSSRN